MMASWYSISTKRKSKRLHAGIEKINLECSVFHRPLLPDQLVQAIALNRAGSACVGVSPVVFPRRSTVEFDRETNRFPVFCGAQHKVKIARMKPENDLAGKRFKHSAFLTHFPASAQGPLIQRKPGLRAVRFSRVFSHRLDRSKISSAFVSNVRFGRTNVLVIRSSFGTAAGGGDYPFGEGCCAVLFEQLLNHALGLVVFTFAEVVITNPSFAVDEVVSRPIIIVESLPNFVIAVDRD